MTKYVFCACWSQTDHEYYIVEEYTKEAALQKLKTSGFNPHHWEYVCTITGKIR
mgnify:CR=1 FL=1